MARCPSDGALTRFLDGTAVDAEDIEAHLADCPSCRLLVASAAPVTQNVPKSNQVEIPKETQGRYEVAAQVGQGGQSVVWSAKDHLLEREVALKVCSPRHGASDTSRTRFLREARITAGLSHPGIIPIHDLGVRRDGSPYYTMRRVGGRTLAQAMESVASLDERLSLLGHVIDVCQAVAYAHSQGVVHRDLKPQNVMIGEFGDTIILDWGLAKEVAPIGVSLEAADGQYNVEGTADRAREARGVHSTGDQTMVGSSIGTPAYMSPEQADVGIESVDARTDVWCLGALLYHLLCGQAPYSGSSTEEILTRARSSKRAGVLELVPTVPPDLAAICERAMSMERKDRYPDARELAGELLRYQSGRRVRAYEYGRWELFRRFVSAHKAAVLAGASILVATIATLIIVTLALSREATARQFAEDSANQATTANQRSSRYLAQAYADKAERLIDDTQALTARIYAAAAVDALGGMQSEGDFMARIRSVVLRAAVQPFDRLEQVVHPGLSGPAQLATSSQDGLVYCVAGDKAVSYQFSDGTKVAELDLESPARGIAAGSGHLLVASDTGGGVLLASDASVLARLQGGSEATTTVAASSTGLFAVGDRQGSIWLHSLDQQAPIILTGHEGAVLASSFSPDGEILATGGQDATVRTWSTTDGKALRVFRDHTHWVFDVAYTPDGRQLASASSDRTVRLWGGEGQESSVSLVAAQSSVTALAYSVDGQSLATTDGTGQVRVFGPGNRLLGTVDTGVMLYSLALSPDGRKLVAAGDDCSMWWWQLAPQQTWSVPLAAEVSYNLATSPDGALLAIPGFDGSIRILDMVQKRLLKVVKTGTSEVVRVALSEQAEVAVASRDGLIRVFHARDGQLVDEKALLDQTVNAVATTSDGRTIASGGEEGDIFLWAREDGTVTRLGSLEGRVLGVAFSPDGSQLAAVSWGGELGIWQVDSHKQVQQIEIGSEAASVEFSSDGSSLLIAGKDMVTQYQASDLTVEQSFKHSTTFNTAKFTGDNKSIVAAGYDGQVRIWDRTSGELIAMMPAASPVFAMAPDGSWWSVAHETVVTVHSTKLPSLTSTGRPRSETEFDTGQILDGFELTWNQDAIGTK